MKDYAQPGLRTAVRGRNTRLGVVQRVHVQAVICRPPQNRLFAINISRWTKPAGIVIGDMQP